MRRTVAAMGEAEIEARLLARFGQRQPTEQAETVVATRIDTLTPLQRAFLALEEARSASRRGDGRARANRSR